MATRLTGWSEVLVKKMAEHKSTMLGFAFLTAAALAGISIVVVFYDHEGGQLTHLAADIGGYVAIAGLVIGFPALGYAMVTDHSVDEMRGEIGVSEEQVDTLEDQIEGVIAGSGWDLWPRHHVQVFIPDALHLSVVPIYDPKGYGPEKGWSIDEKTPQAITGSAWVKDEYLCGLRGDLKKPRLRLNEDQLNRYHDLTGVAAVPIHDPDRAASGEMRIGVLTVFTNAPSPMMEQDDFEERHTEVAALLAPLLSPLVPRLGPLDQSADLSEGQAAIADG